MTTLPLLKGTSFIDQVVEDLHRTNSQHRQCLLGDLPSLSAGPFKAGMVT